MNTGMTPEERRALEQRAERSTRRGDLADAVDALKTLSTRFPEEAQFRNKLAEIQGSLQPSELMNPKARIASEKPSTNSQADRAEQCAARGDYRQAITIYRQLIAAQPDADLLKERLAELFQLAQASVPRAAPVAPVDPMTALNDMLERISSRKRK